MKSAGLRAVTEEKWALLCWTICGDCLTGKDIGDRDADKSEDGNIEAGITDIS